MGSFAWDSQTIYHLYREQKIYHDAKILSSKSHCYLVDVFLITWQAVGLFLPLADSC
jgi:hypothetical protein